MNLSGKKLTTAILAGLMGATMFGSSVFADDAQRLTNVEVLATQNKGNIDILKNDVRALKDASTKDTYSKDEVDNKLADKANQSDVTTNANGIATNKQAISDEATARQNADAAEKKAREDADSQLNTKMISGFTTIQGQQDEQDAKIDKNQKGIQTNAGNIQKNTDAIQANSDKIADHEDRISSNEKNIENNAESIKKVQGDVVDNKNAIATNTANIQKNSEAVAKVQEDYTTVKDTVQFIKDNKDAIDHVNTMKTQLDATTAVADNNHTAIQKEISDRQDADAAEKKAREDADSQLNTKIISGFATIQGQQDEQDAKIDKNQKDIQTNAGNIKTNTDAIKANSDKLTNHEERITNNEKNIENNAETIKKVQGDVVDNKNAISAEIADRQAADKNLQTQINNNNTSVNNEAAERKAADQNLQNQINNNSTSINDLYGRYSSLKTDINKVGARSAALAGLHPLDFDPANKLNFAVASGSFKGENSVALGAFYRPNENIMFSAASTMGDSDNAYTFGLSFKIGPSSAKTKTTSPDAEELYKVVGELQDQLAAQQKEIEQLKAGKAK